MTRSPRFWLILGTLVATLNFWFVTKADAFYLEGWLNWLFGPQW